MHVRCVSLALSSALLVASGCDSVEAPPASPAGAPGEAEGVRDSVGTSVGPVSRAIIQRNAGNDQKLGLLARVEVQPNELIEFYEPQPGRLMVSAAGAPSAPPLLIPDKARSAEQWWQLAARGKPMPSRLRDAVARAGSVVASPGAETEGPASHALGGGNAAAELNEPSLNVQAASGSSGSDGGPAGWCDNGYFASHHSASPHSVPTGLPPTFSVDRNNWGNGYWAQAGRIHGFYTNVCPATGPVQLQINNSNVNINPTTFNVPVNTVRWSQYENMHCGPFWNPCFSVRVDVLQAQGDRFHVRFSSQ